MLISKFDLYKTEWLDLVFDNRNKEYGAYELRQHYNRTMARAMGIAFLTVALLCGATIIFSAAPVTTRSILVVISPPVLPPPIKEIKKVDPPAPAKPLKPENPPATQRVVEMIVAPENRAEKPVKNDEITLPVSSVNTKGPATGNNVLPVSTASGTGTQPTPDISIHDTGGLDVMPEPVGGDKAWAKFLNKNLRFPPAAQEEGVSGRVILSFVIEKDGSLSNISIERGAGHGFDEEALRVLKLAKAWKPGMQNGQPVRVRYDIPINFQLAPND